MTSGAPFGVDLDGSHVELGAHLMRAGDRIDAHNDARNGSGERVRLLLYVGIDARRLRGGGLNLLRSAEAGDLGVEIVPGHDRAVAFAISSRSFHSVPAIIDGARCSISLSFRARDWAARAASIPLTIEGAPSPVVSLLDRLGAVRVPHVSSHAGRWKARSLRQPLRNHLCATRIVLERWGCDEPVCLAGLCHGLYGPPGVDTALLSPNQRSVLRRVVGREGGKSCVPTLDVRSGSRASQWGFHRQREPGRWAGAVNRPLGVGQDVPDLLGQPLCPGTVHRAEPGCCS